LETSILSDLKYFLKVSYAGEPVNFRVPPLLMINPATSFCPNFRSFELIIDKAFDSKSKRSSESLSEGSSSEVLLR